jgi:Domain of unknown function (DUF1876)
MENNYTYAMSFPEHDLSVSGLVDRNASVVQVIYTHYDEGNGAYFTQATGSSKREQGDVFDAELGYELALARALQNLSRKIKSQADAKIAAYYHVDNVPEPAPEPAQEQDTTGDLWAPEFQGHFRRRFLGWLQS